MSLTLEDLIAKSGVKNVDRECTGEDILAFGDFCDPWRQVGLYLGLDRAELNAIDEDYRTVSLKRLGTLQEWKSRFAFNATYRVLITALLECGKADHALKVCQILAQKEALAGSAATCIEVQMPVVQQAPPPVVVTSSKLDLVIDAENRSSKHLGQIADSMHEWQGAIADELGLSQADVATITTKYPTQLNLQARAALEKWKQMNGSAATYRNLVGVFESAGYRGYAATVRNIFASSTTGSTSTPNPPSRSSTTPASVQAASPRSNEVARSQSFPGAVHSKHLKLIKWTEGSETKKFYLMEKIESKWRDIGQLAGLSLSQLESIATEHREKPAECCRAILGRWMDNPPKEYPTTWNGLIELLEDSELTSAVKDLKTALSKAKLP